MSHVYERLGVATCINGAGTLTRLGGSLMPREVQETMREAAGHFVDMTELHARAGSIIAGHAGSEAAIVTSGAAAALTLATAACIARLDPRIMDRLPDTDGLPNEVIMFRAHRNSYDHAIRAAGARIVEVGFNDVSVGAGVRGLEAWEIEAAITPRTVALAFVAGGPNEASLPAMCAVAARHGLPVIVDAAAQLPPRENLRRFIAEGAALVCFSGGKAIRGPQNTGILAGRKDLIVSALMQMLDMDVSPGGWKPGGGLVPEALLRTPPHHGVGRGFKVAKEAIVGLVTALELFLARDPMTEAAAMLAELEAVATVLEGAPGVEAVMIDRGAAKPMLRLAVAPTAAGLDAAELSARLQALPRPVHLSERWVRDGVLLVDPIALQPGEGALIGQALRRVLAG